MSKKETQTGNSPQEKAVVEDAKTPEKPNPVQTESVYTVEELAVNAKEVFGTNYECVVAALKAANISQCTVSEAKETVKVFLEKEVQ